MPKKKKPIKIPFRGKVMYREEKGKKLNKIVTPLEFERQKLKEAEAQRLKDLERENRELRRANEILRKASAFFAQAELDRRPK